MKNGWTRLIAAALAAGLAAPTAPAQDRRTPPGGPAVLLEFAETPMRIDSVGLTMLLPTGAGVQSQRLGTHTTVRVAPAPPDETWILNVDTPQSSNLDLTPARVAEEVLNQILESVGVPLQKPDAGKGFETKSVESAGVVLERNDAVTIPGSRTSGSRFYVKLPRGAGEAPAIRGYTVFQIGPGRFVTFDLLTTEPQFARTRRIYELTVATAKFEDASTVTATRGAAVEAGVAVLSGLTPADLEQIIKNRPETWYRVYREAATKASADANELGYQRVRAWMGQRGELDSTRERSRWQAADRQAGVLVQIEGRSIREPRMVDGKRVFTVIDTRGTYFMTPDRTEEAWAIQMAIRDPGKRTPETWLETGARSSGSMSVTVSGAARVGESARPFVPDHGYANQVESLLLPQILIRSAKAGEYGLYTYQSEFGNVRLRRDVLERPADGSEMWRVTTRMHEDAEPRVSLYRDSGELISSRLPDGTILEPTTFERLMNLWKSKGLPLN